MKHIYEAWAIVGPDNKLPENAAALYTSEVTAECDARSTDRVVKVRVTIETIDTTPTTPEEGAER